MEANNLVVTVHGARGLSMKGVTELEAVISLVLQGKSSLRSKAETEVVQCSGNAEWNESLEFKLMEGASKLTASVNNRGRFGRTDLIGKVDLPLEEIQSLKSPMWFPLSKKTKDEKYRGELMLSFVFSFVRSQLSISNLSLNTIQKDNVLKRMKRKLATGLKVKEGSNADNLSIASAFPALRGRRSEPADSQFNQTFARGSSSRMSHRFSRQSLTPSGAASLNGGQDTKNSVFSASPGLSASNALSSSPISTVNSFSNLSGTGSMIVAEVGGVGERGGASLPRPGSAASSGFGSHRSRGQERGPESGGGHEWDLAVEVDRLRAELAVKDSRLRDMEEYVDRLLSRVMESHPDLLATSPSTVRKPGGVRSRFLF